MSRLFSTEFAHRFAVGEAGPEVGIYVTYCGYRVLESTAHESQSGRFLCEHCERLTKNLRMKTLSSLTHAPAIPASSSKYIFAKCGKVYDTSSPKAESFFTEENITCMECLVL